MGVTQVDPQPKSYGGLSNFPEDPPANEGRAFAAVDSVSSVLVP